MTRTMHHKRLYCLALTLLLMLCAIGGAVAEQEQEWIDLNIIAVSGNFASFKDAQGTPVLQKIMEDTKVNLTVTPVDVDKWNVILAGGDTTDILMFEHGTYLKTLVDGDLILPLNGLLDQYGENVRANSPERLAYVAEMAGEGNEEVYCIPYNGGAEGGNAKATNSGLLTRWDLYKAIGAPEIKDMDDYVNALAEMVALEPTTEDGLPVYGVTLFNVDNRFYPIVQYVRCLGFEQYNDWVATRIADNTFSYGYTDEDSSFWQGIEFCQKAYMLGILDPDSFTQKYEDALAKQQNGQILTPTWRDHTKQAQIDWLAEDPENLRGFAIVPMEGSYIAENKNAIIGGTFSAAIAKTCKDPERAMQFIDYLHDLDTARLIFCGIQGEHWDVIDGVPQPTDEAIALKAAGGDAWTATGVNNSALYGMVGAARGVEMPDGALTDLYRSEGFFVKSLDAIDEDYCAYYGDYAYPNQVLLDKGTGDLSNLDMRIAGGYGTAPEDIQRIDARLLEMALRSIPDLVMCESAEAFEAAKASAIETFTDAGADQSRDWWASRHAELFAKYQQ